MESASVLGLQCSFNTAAITEYFGLALEYMGNKFTTTPEDKKRVHDNILRLLNVSDTSTIFSYISSIFLQATATPLYQNTETLKTIMRGKANTSIYKEK